MTLDELKIYVGIWKPRIEGFLLYATGEEANVGFGNDLWGEGGDQFTFEIHSSAKGIQRLVAHSLLYEDFATTLNENSIGVMLITA